MATKQMVFRFDENLIELVKEKVLAQKRSLNNYIEYLLYQNIGNIPNKETIKAIEEAHSSKNLESVKKFNYLAIRNINMINVSINFKENDI